MIDDMNKIDIITTNFINSKKYKNRDYSIVLFGAWFGNRFADNSRYLFQYLSENKNNLGLTHVVWVTRSDNVYFTLNQMGYECYLMDSEKSIYYHKIAGIHIVCNSAELVNGDILPQYSTGAVKINLWHGLGGIKGVEFASKQYEIAKKVHPIKYSLKEFLNRRSMYRKYAIRYGGWGDCLYLSTTPFQTNIFKKYFYRDTSHFIEAGYPRNLPCLRFTPEELNVIDMIRNKKNIILYLPTFRENSNNYQTPLDNLEVKELVQSEDFYWIEKKHNFTGASGTVVDDHILKLDSSFDICTILPFVDLVVTDYSSVSWDALYYNIPVFFYIPDFEKYESDDRGFVLPKEEFLIGQTAKTTDELKKLLIKYKNNYHSSINCDYNFKKMKYWGEEKSFEQIWREIYSYINCSK